MNSLIKDSNGNDLRILEKTIERTEKDYEAITEPKTLSTITEKTTSTTKTTIKISFTSTYTTTSSTTIPRTTSTTTTTPLTIAFKNDFEGTTINFHNYDNTELFATTKSPLSITKAT